MSKICCTNWNFETMLKTNFDKQGNKKIDIKIAITKMLFVTTDNTCEIVQLSLLIDYVLQNM